MCTMIAVTGPLTGAAKGPTGWFPITQATSRRTVRLGQPGHRPPRTPHTPE